MGTAKTKRVSDFFEGEVASILSEVTQLQTQFGRWESLDGRGTRELWGVLGRVYELGPQIDQNGAAKTELIENVRRNRLGGINSSWDPEKKGSHELLLVLLLGLREETKARKSQWLSAIKAAKRSEIEPEGDAFVSYMKDIGGIESARKTLVRKSQAKLAFPEAASAALSLLDPDRPAFVPPNLFTDGGEIEGEVAVVLVRSERSGGSAIPIAMLTDRPVVEAAIYRLLKKVADADSAERRARADEELAIARKFRRSLRKKYQAWLKTSDGKHTRLEFSEYVEERMGEDEDLIEAALHCDNLYHAITHRY